MIPKIVKYILSINKEVEEDEKMLRGYLKNLILHFTNSSDIKDITVRDLAKKAKWSNDTAHKALIASSVKEKEQIFKPRALKNWNERLERIILLDEWEKQLKSPNEILPLGLLGNFDFIYRTADGIYKDSGIVNIQEGGKIELIFPEEERNKYLGRGEICSDNYLFQLKCIHGNTLKDHLTLLVKKSNKALLHGIALSIDFHGNAFSSPVILKKATIKIEKIEEFFKEYESKFRKMVPDGKENYLIFIAPDYYEMKEILRKFDTL